MDFWFLYHTLCWFFYKNWSTKKNWIVKIFPSRKNSHVLTLGPLSKFLPSCFLSLFGKMIEILSFSKILKCTKNHGCSCSIIATKIRRILQTISFPTVVQTFKSDFYLRVTDQKHFEGDMPTFTKEIRHFTKNWFTPSVLNFNWSIAWTLTAEWANSPVYMFLVILTFWKMTIS